MVGFEHRIKGTSKLGFKVRGDFFVFFESISILKGKSGVWPRIALKSARSIYPYHSLFGMEDSEEMTEI